MRKDRVGKEGERRTAEYLVQNGHTVREKNYSKRTGEIDIITKDRDNVLHFVEVKTVKDQYELKWLRAEERIGEDKVRHIRNTISLYMEENDLRWEEVEWVFDLAVVCLEPQFSIRIEEDLIL